MTYAELDESSVDRFWQNIVVVDACWEWSAYRNPLGYGQLRVGPRVGGRARFAHRVSWCIRHGVTLASIDDMHICHRCDNPPCCNPAHLFLGTAADNMADMVAKGRYNHNRRMARGSEHWRSVLTEETAAEILHCGGNQYDVAARFGVSQGTVHLIRARKIWKHIS